MCEPRGVAVLDQRELLKDNLSRDAIKPGEHASIAENAYVVEWRLDCRKHVANCRFCPVHRLRLSDVLRGEGVQAAAKLDPHPNRSAMKSVRGRHAKPQGSSATSVFTSFGVLLRVLVARVHGTAFLRKSRCAESSARRAW